MCDTKRKRLKTMLGVALQRGPERTTHDVRDFLVGFNTSASRFLLTVLASCRASLSSKRQEAPM